jgi:transposase
MVIMTYNHIKTVGDKHYLYRVTGVWDPVKKNSRQVREYVGPCDEDGNLVESRRREAVIASKTFGPYWLLQKISDSLGLEEKLRDCFGRDVGEDILSIAMLRCVRPLPLRQVDDQMQESFLSEYRSNDGMGSRDLSRLMMGISEKSRNLFFGSIYEGGGAIIFDLSSFGSESARMSRLEYGDDYRKIHMPQVSMGMVHSMDSGRPFCYRLYSGSISDVSTLKNMAEFVSSLGCDDVHFVMDRGFYSESNLLSLLDAGMGFTTPVPSGRKVFKSVVSESVRDNSSLSTYMFCGSVFRVYETRVAMGDRYVRAISYLDEGRRLDEIGSLYSRICSFESVLSDAKWTKGIHKKLRERFGTDILRFFDLSDDGGKVAFQRKRNAITARENVCGRMVILTTSEDPWDTVLSRYRSRNDIEFDFRQLKSDLEGGVRYLQTDGTADGLIFVQFVSLILRSELLRRISKSELKGKVWYPDVINELSKLKVSRMGSKLVLNEVTKKQRDLFVSLKVDVPTTESVRSLVTKS